MVFIVGGSFSFGAVDGLMVYVIAWYLVPPSLAREYVYICCVCERILHWQARMYWSRTDCVAAAYMLGKFTQLGKLSEYIPCEYRDDGSYRLLLYQACSSAGYLPCKPIITVLLYTCSQSLGLAQLYTSTRDGLETRTTTVYSSFISLQDVMIYRSQITHWPLQ